MKFTKHITKCKCCGNTYHVDWKHNGIVVEVSNWRNAELGFDVTLHTRKRRGQDSEVGNFAIDLNLMWFTLSYRGKFRNRWYSNKSGNLDVYPFTDVCVSGQAYVHQYPLNALWDWGWVFSFPFIPTVAYHRCRLRTPEEEVAWELDQYV